MLFLSPKHVSFLLLFVSISLGGYAQVDKTERPKESDILIEKIFIEANREKILGNIDEAIHLYLEVLQKDNNNAASNYELARLYKRQDQYDKAIVRAEKAVVLEQFNLLYCELYASLLEKEGNYKKAAELYATLSAEYPDNEQLYYDWGYFLGKSDKADQAIKVYNTLEKRVGVKDAISMRKYKLYMATGKDKKASQELERLVDTYPNEGEYIIRLANYHASTQDFEKAKELYQKALDIDPNNSTANMAMVDFYLHSGDTARYLSALINTFDNPNQDFNQKLNTLQSLVDGLALNKLKEHENAIFELSNKLIETNPQSASVNFLHAELLYKRKSYQTAAKHYTAAISLLKNNLLLWQHLLESLYQCNNNKELQTKSAEMMDLYPSQASSFYYYGVSLFQQEKYAQAEKELKQAADIAVSDVEIQGKALRALAKVFVATDKAALADKTYNDCLTLLPNHPETINEYAFSLAKQNIDLPKAANLVKGILEKQPQNPKFITTNGYILFKQSQYALAEKEISKALGLGGSEIPETLESYGDVQFKLGNESEAISYWEKALNKVGSSSRLQQKISNKKLNE